MWAGAITSKPHDVDTVVMLCGHLGIVYGKNIEAYLVIKLDWKITVVDINMAGCGVVVDIIYE